MPVSYSYLNNVDFSEIYSCFLEAFADYHIDMSYMNQQAMYNRMCKNGVDYNVSVGAFDNGKMVGFTLIGIDDWRGQKAAFDAGTGIVPDFRGKGIARKMFEFSIPKCKELGIEKFLLEVLRVNEAGIKAYQKTGFNITRELDCFALQVDQFKSSGKPVAGIVIRQVERDILSQFAPHLDWQPSWENSFSSISRIPDEVNIYGAFTGDKCVGILAFYPALNWVMSLVIKRNYRLKGIAVQLVTHCVPNLPKTVKTIKALNIESTAVDMINLFKQLGFEETSGQYEMAMDL